MLEYAEQSSRGGMGRIFFQLGNLRALNARRARTCTAAIRDRASPLGAQWKRCATGECLGSSGEDAANPSEFVICWQRKSLVAAEPPCYARCRSETNSIKAVSIGRARQ
jgi:hypothetical protein